MVPMGIMSGSLFVFFKVSIIIMMLKRRRWTRRRTRAMLIIEMMIKDG